MVQEHGCLCKTAVDSLEQLLLWDNQVDIPSLTLAVLLDMLVPYDGGQCIPVRAGLSASCTSEQVHPHVLQNNS